MTKIVNHKKTRRSSNRLPLNARDNALFCQRGASGGNYRADSDSQLNQTIRFIPSLNLAALNQHKDRELYLWYLLRALSQAITNGSARLPVEAAYYTLVKGLHLYTPWSFYLHLRLGEGVFWQTWTNGSTQINVYGLKIVSEYLNTYPEGFIELDYEQLISSTKLRMRRASLYQTGAYKPQGKAVNPISRQSLEEKTGVSRRQQQKYDSAIETERQETQVKYRDPHTFRYRVVKEPIETSIGVLELPKQLGNLYHSKAIPSHRGICRKVAKIMRAGKVSYLGGEARPEVSLVKRYFKVFSDYIKSFLKGKAGELGYYPLKSKPWVYVQCMILD